MHTSNNTATQGPAFFHLMGCKHSGPMRSASAWPAQPSLCCVSLQMSRAVCAVALLAASVQGAVIGIDLGSRFLKVGIIQPGSGIELVLNEATKRKSSSTVCSHGHSARGAQLPTGCGPGDVRRRASRRKRSASMATTHTTSWANCPRSSSSSRGCCWASRSTRPRSSFSRRRAFRAPLPSPHGARPGLGPASWLARGRWVGSG